MPRGVNVPKRPDKGQLGDLLNSPRYIRLPKTGTRCPHSGLSRSTLNTLILPSKENGFRPSVKSKIVAQPEKKRGVRLIVYSSLMDYLDNLPGDDGGNNPDGQVD